ncbi:hypothetical protein [Cedecea sp. P7760]|nr:hypothetical protein [Cedecea sp. P7760]
MTFIKKILSYFTPARPVLEHKKGRNSYPAAPGRKRREKKA